MRTGLLDQLQVTLQLFPFACRRNADDAAVMAFCAFMHIGSRLAVIHVFSVRDDHRIQRMALFHRRLHDRVILHAYAVITERVIPMSANAFMSTTSSPFSALSDGRVRDDMHMGVGSDLFLIGFHHFHMIRIRQHIGHGHDGP